MNFMIKICGLSDVVALDAALGAGADMVGFVHFPRSPRHVALDVAKHFVDHVRNAPQQRSGVAEACSGLRTQSVVLTVDPDDATVARIVAEVAPDWLQLHGSETPERVAAIAAAHDVGIIKAVGVSGAADIDLALQYDAADLMLLDARPPRDASRPGGNGVAFDWDLARDTRLPPFMLSGGLDPENIALALAALAGQQSLAGVDVSSGVESALGVKNPALVEAFIRAARRARA